MTAVVLVVATEGAVEMVVTAAVGAQMVVMTATTCTERHLSIGQRQGCSAWQSLGVAGAARAELAKNTGQKSRTGGGEGANGGGFLLHFGGAGLLHGGLGGLGGFGGFGGGGESGGPNWN